MSGISCGAAGGASGSPTGTEACGAAGDGAGMTSGGMGASSAGGMVGSTAAISFAYNSFFCPSVSTTPEFSIIVFTLSGLPIFCVRQSRRKYHFRISTIVKIT